MCLRSEDDTGSTAFALCNEDEAQRTVENNHVTCEAPPTADFTQKRAGGGTPKALWDGGQVGIDGTRTDPGSAPAHVMLPPPDRRRATACLFVCLFVVTLNEAAGKFPGASVALS